MMKIGGEDEGDPEHGEEVPHQHALLAQAGIDRGDESKAQLLRDDEAGHLQRGHDQPHRQSEHRADEHLLAEHRHERTE